MLPGVSAGQWQPAAVWPPPQSPAHQQNTERGPYGLDVPPLTEGCWACLQLLSVKLTKERIPRSHPSPDIIQTTSHPYSANIFYVLKSNNEWKSKKEIWTKSSEKRAQWAGRGGGEWKGKEQQEQGAGRWPFTAHTAGARTCLFTVPVFCRGTANTESVSAEALLLGEIQGQVPANPWSHHFCQLINT